MSLPLTRKAATSRVRTPTRIGSLARGLSSLMRVDQALGLRDAEIHEACEYGRNALFRAQFAHGGFPQVWSGVVPTTRND